MKPTRKIKNNVPVIMDHFPKTFQHLNLHLKESHLGYEEVPCHQFIYKFYELWIYEKNYFTFLKVIFQIRFAEIRNLWVIERFIIVRYVYVLSSVIEYGIRAVFAVA